MKRFLALACLAIALSGPAAARPVAIHVPHTIGSFFGWLSFLWTHLHVRPMDGTVTIPPPH